MSDDYKCNLCNRTYKTSGSLASHRYRYHRQPSPDSMSTVSALSDTLTRMSDLDDMKHDHSDTDNVLSDTNSDHVLSDTNSEHVHSDTDHAHSDTNSEHVHSDVTSVDDESKLRSAIIELREAHEELEAEVQRQEESLHRIYRELKLDKPDSNRILPRKWRKFGIGL